MLFHHFLLDNNESNAYILACDTTREALLVDAGCWDPAIGDFISEHDLKLTTVFITHDHYDHTEGLDAIVDRYHPEVVSLRGRLGQSRARRTQHGDEIRIGDLVGRVLDTTGHTADSISLAFPGLVFTGDALFAGSVGGTGSPKAGERQHARIVEHIFSLPLDTEIQPGHGPSSTVEIEKNYNPFFSRLAD